MPVPAETGTEFLGEPEVLEIHNIEKRWSHSAYRGHRAGKPLSRGELEPEPAAPLPGEAVSPQREQARGSAKVDASQPRVLRCEEGAQGRRLWLTPQVGRPPGRAGTRPRKPWALCAVRHEHAAASLQREVFSKSRFMRGNELHCRGNRT